MNDERDTIVTESTSNVTSEVRQFPIREADDGTTRRVLTGRIVYNAAHPENSLAVDLIHERRARGGAPWDPIDSINLATLRGGEWAKVSLDTADTAALYSALRDLYALADHGPRQGIVEWRRMTEGALVVEGEEAEVLSKLLSDVGREELFRLLGELHPGLAEFVAKKHMLEERERAVREFEEHLADADWSETDWHGFLNRNQWMFGLGLNYVLLRPIKESRPMYGGTDFSGSGAVQGDVLAATEANARFTVLVELKTPSTLLVGSSYRNQVRKLGEDLVGGVAQVQAQCELWSHTALEHQNRRLANLGIHTYAPRGVLLIGDLTQLLDNDDALKTFELYRRNLVNPDVITFDELLARARFVVEGARDDAEQTAPKTDDFAL